MTRPIARSRSHSRWSLSPPRLPPRRPARRATIQPGARQGCSAGLHQVVAACVPGAVLLVREGRRTIRPTSGHSRLKPTTPMRARDRFRVGGITKPIVATVALLLVGEHKLTLEDTVERWLPGLVPNGEHISVRQLLNHTSGLFAFGRDRDRDFIITQAFQDPLRVWTPREIIAIATTHPPTFAPGTDWSYSAAG